MEYLNEMDAINPGQDSAFKTEEDKIDHETKLCCFFRKLEAADFHKSNICAISERERQRIAAMPDPEMKVGMRGQTEIRIEDRAILFEIDAFFAAARSALDFLAVVISKYLRGKTLHRFKKVVDEVRGRSDPIASLIEQAWMTWGKDLVSYRDHLIHRGIISSSSASNLRASVPKYPDGESKEIPDVLLPGNGIPVIFPIPRKPESSSTLTRREILEETGEELPRGLNRTEAVLRFSCDGRNIERRAMRYELAPGYIEACELCQYYEEELQEFSLELFRLIGSNRFTYVSGD